MRRADDQAATLSEPELFHAPENRRARRAQVALRQSHAVRVASQKVSAGASKWDEFVDSIITASRFVVGGSSLDRKQARACSAAFLQQAAPSLTPSNPLARMDQAGRRRRRDRRSAPCLRI